MFDQNMFNPNMLNPNMLDSNTVSASSRVVLRKAVGITKGPGEANHEYTFVSRDDEQVLKNGEYVYYELADPEYVALHHTNIGAPMRRVLGRVIKRVPLQLYPDTFLGEPEIPPEQVAAMVGYNSRTNELFELHVAIMGYYDTATSSFLNPGFLLSQASRFSWPIMRCWRPF